MTNSATYAVKTNIVFSFGAKLSLNPNIIPKENSCLLIFPKSSRNSQKMKYGFQYRALTTALLKCLLYKSSLTDLKLTVNHF
jgi:hypothetical protein